LWRVGSRRRAAVTPAWTCGQLVEPALAWTSSGFTKPLRLVLEGVLRPTRELTVRSDSGVVQEVLYEAEVPHLFDTLIYEPATASALRGAAVIRRLQSGSLRTYLIYLLGLLVVLLALVRLGVLA
jgi:hydrogenase-4 component B